MIEQLQTQRNGERLRSDIRFKILETAPVENVRVASSMESQRRCNFVGLRGLILINFMLEKEKAVSLTRGSVLQRGQGNFTDESASVLTWHIIESLPNKKFHAILCIICVIWLSA